MLLAERLRWLRESKGLTQRELSQLCNFGINQISRYENGLSDPTSESLTILAKSLAVSVDYLLGLTNDPQGNFTSMEIEPIEREMIDAFRRYGWPGVFKLGGEKMINEAKVSDSST